MKRLEPEIIDYYDNEVVMMISEKYGLSQMDAYEKNKKGIAVGAGIDCYFSDCHSNRWK